MLQVSHHILSPSSLQMFCTTSTKICSGLRSVTCWPALPPHNHPALQANSTTSSQASRMKFIQRVRRNTNCCWEKTNKASETQASSCYITTGPVMGLAHPPPSHEPPSAQAHGESQREGSTAMPKNISSTSKAATWSIYTCFPRISLRWEWCLFTRLSTDRCKMMSL